jgi:hypothetical protein
MGQGDRFRYVLGVLFCAAGIASWLGLRQASPAGLGSRTVTDLLADPSVRFGPAMLVVGGLLLLVRPLLPARSVWLLVYSGIAVWFTPTVIDSGILSMVIGSPSPFVYALATMFFGLPLCALAVAASAVPRPARRNLAVLLAVAGGIALLASDPAIWMWTKAQRASPVSGWSFTVEILLMISKPTLVAACVGLTGVFAKGWRGVPGALATALVVLCLGGIAGTVATISIFAGWSLSAVEALRTPLQLVSSAGAGLGALLATRLPSGLLARDATPSTDTSSPTSGSRDWRSVAGWVLATLGASGWSVVAMTVAPVAEDAYRGWPAFRATAPGADVDDVGAFGMFAEDLRWAAMLVALGGLLLVARGRRRGLALACGYLAWAAADVVLDLTGVRGWPAAAISAAAVLAIFGALLAGPRRSVAGDARWTLLYSGVAVAVAAATFLPVQPWAADVLPAWAVPVGLAVTVLLSISAVVVALAIAPAATPGRARAALLVGVAGAACAVLSYLVGIVWPGNQVIVADVVLPVGVGAVTLGCLRVAGLGRRARRTLLRSTVLPALTVTLMNAGLVTAAAVFWAVHRIWRSVELVDSYSATISGVVVGAAIALVLLAFGAPETPVEGAEPTPVRRGPASGRVPIIVESPATTG